MSNEYHDQREALYEAGQLEALHRPLAGGDTFKGGLAGTRPAAAPAPVYGWICAKCGCGNAPHRETCARCTRPYS